MAAPAIAGTEDDSDAALALELTLRAIEDALRRHELDEGKGKAPSYLPAPILLPVVHEIIAASASLGVLITGREAEASEIIEHYKKESVLGSAALQAYSRYYGDEEGAAEYARGFRRASSKAVLGGGLFPKVPIFHELKTAGDSLADIVGDSDTAAAARHWEEYSEHSVVGTGVKVVAAKTLGDEEEAARLLPQLKMATASGVVWGAAAAANVTAIVGTLGMALPVGVAVAGSTQVASDVLGQACDQYMEAGEAPVLEEFSGDVQEGLKRVAPLAREAAAAAAEASGPMLEHTKARAHEGLQRANEAMAPAAEAAWEALPPTLRDDVAQRTATVIGATRSGLEEATVAAEPVVRLGVEDGMWAVEEASEVVARGLEAAAPMLEQTQGAVGHALSAANQVVAPAAEAAWGVTAKGVGDASEMTLRGLGVAAPALKHGLEAAAAITSSAVTSAVGRSLEMTSGAVDATASHVVGGREWQETRSAMGRRVESAKPVVRRVLGGVSEGASTALAATSEATRRGYEAAAPVVSERLDQASGALEQWRRETGLAGTACNTARVAAMATAVPLAVTGRATMAVTKAASEAASEAVRTAAPAATSLWSKSANAFGALDALGWQRSQQHADQPGERRPQDANDVPLRESQLENEAAGPVTP